MPGAEEDRHQQPAHGRFPIARGLQEALGEPACFRRPDGDVARVKNLWRARRPHRYSAIRNNASTTPSMKMSALGGAIASAAATPSRCQTLSVCASETMASRCLLATSVAVT